jgi:hypothetical protein
MDSVERAIGCCYEAADKDWKIMAERRIAELAMRKMPFTSEDIIRYLEYRGLETPDMRALGGIFLKYANSKEIKSVGWTIATRKERHNAPIRVWRGA